MFFAIILWLTFALFSFGALGTNYIYTQNLAKRSWKTKIDASYMPTISIIVPTYNESEVIGYKLRNLAKLNYPKKMMEIIFVDSQSTDSTLDAIKIFADSHSEMNIKILVESERKGKSQALNLALKHCNGEVVGISDADCFWTPTILTESLPFMADLTVGAISGPKKLLNTESSWVTKSEDAYLKSMNLMKLGESKKATTIFFEGGFSVYKKEVLESFDPYNTGSDDCGTIISILEKGFRALMVSQAEFFTTFPETLNGKLKIKIRRANQLIRILQRYVVLLFQNRIKIARGTIAKNILLYLFGPVMFLFFVATTAYIMLKTPLMLILFLMFLIPKVRNYLFEAILNYSILLFSFISIGLKRKFTVWKKPEDRTLLIEDALLQRGLI
jgi:cellulose synthase/poly-beta-1,6-N-acetylglucosamine synthase-like glycosyltransferase